MILRILETGPLMVNCYILGDEDSGESAVFDPGGDADRILMQLAKDKLTAKMILNTHTHWDHTGGNQALHAATGAPIMTHREEAPALQHVSELAAGMGVQVENSEASAFVAEGDEIRVGAIRIDVIDLRGHSPAGLGFVFTGEWEMEGERRPRTGVICGDALFAGSIGRTDFPGGNLNLLLDNIRNKIFTLPDDTLVLPGHGPTSTVGREKQYNPFF